MTELEQYRQEIDRIDGELVQLFLERMAVTGKVGEYKQRAGIPVLDAGREKQVIAAKTALTDDPASSRLARTRSKYRGATWLSVTTKSREAPGRTARSSSPARASSPRPICMLYSRPGRATVSVFMVRPPLFKIDGIRRAGVGTRPYATAPQVAPTQGPAPQGGLSCPCGAIHLLPSSAHANYPPPSP